MSTGSSGQGYGMQFGLLGPLELVDWQGDRVPVVGARLRVLLAALLLEADTPVSWEALAEAVWDGAPPPGAARTLRSHIARLRRILGPEAGRVVAHDPGYQIRVTAAELDVLQFEDWCLKASSALRRDAWMQASDAAACALELWRGEPLLDVPCLVLRERFAPRLKQLRLQALEDRAEAQLRLGRHEPLVPELQELTAAHPLRERFHAQLMLALAGCGRRGEALDAYRDARRMLVAELGIEPGRELRELHGRILAGVDPRPATKPSNARTLTPAATGAAPRQLPAAAGHFTGRHAQLQWLTALANRSETAAGIGGTVVISAIDGMAGIGKTALAIHAGHRLAERFPDGQLFVDLHGYTKGYPPRESGEVLEAFLRALGVPAPQVPKDTEARAALYRQRLADTRTLIVLDNASDETQVRPLLPGAPGCLVLVTSRRRLKGLDSHTLSLDLLAPPDAAALLRAVAGSDRIRADDPLLAEIAQLCGHLPLALRIAGALLRHRPAWSLGHLAVLLRDRHRRVPALSDGERDLASVFDLSYTGLPEQHQRLFRNLALIPGPDTDAYAAAALMGVDPQDTTRLLEDLVDHNLLIAHAPGRYRLHDLLRAHAHTLADQDPAEDRQAALDRLLHYYAHTAQNASIRIARYPRSAPGGPAPAHAPDLPCPEAARTWLRTERDNLEAAHTHARTVALDEHAIALATGLAEILRTDGPFHRALELHEAAAETARHRGHPTVHATTLHDLGIARRLTGNLLGADDALTQALEICCAAGHRIGEANALNDLGIVRQLTGNAPGAADALNQALEIYRDTGNHLGEANALSELGRVLHLTGDYSGAADALTGALDVYRTIGHRHGEANALSGLGRVRQLTGDAPGAADALNQALEICRAIGNRLGEANALSDLGRVHRLTRDYSGAADAHTQALEIYRDTGNRHGEAYALTDLGRVRQLSGDLPAARAALTQALEIYRDTGNRNNEAWALNHYAATVAANGDLTLALALYWQALDMNSELNKPDDEAISLEGLGECHLATGETKLALANLEQALKIFHRLGMAPDAERVQARLTQLTEH